MAVRDLGLLGSALHRPQQQMYGVQAYSELFEKAAALLQSLTSNRALIDGNERTAWMCTVVFLDINGADMADVDQEQAYDLVVDIASGKLDEVKLIAEELRRLREGGAV